MVVVLLLLLLLGGGGGASASSAAAVGGGGQQNISGAAVWCLHDQVEYMALQVLAFLRTQPPDKLGLVPLLHMLAVVSAASAITNYAPCEALWVLLQCCVATSNGTDLLHVRCCTCLPFACRLPLPCRQRPQYLPTAGRSEVSSAPHVMACVLAVFLCTVLQLTTHHTSQTVQGCAAT
jgi:hypothetical protein